MTIIEIVEWLVSLTPTGIFAMLYVVERFDRRALQKQADELRDKQTERLINAINASTVAVQGLKEILTAGRN